MGEKNIVRENGDVELSFEKAKICSIFAHFLMRIS